MPQPNSGATGSPQLTQGQIVADGQRPAVRFTTPLALWEYAIDSAQRAVLFWDALRQRGNQFFAHEASGAPPVLVYEYELLIDGRTLERPVNYMLLRIIPQAGQNIDPHKRPYVIVDPRAGHGPGIGGSKEDSQIGVALRAGHPVYFVSFRPIPEPGQTLEDISRAEELFLREVIRRHPAAPRPCVIGNCQAGWAVAMLAAIAPDLMGPIVLNGAPVSYWAGADGKNPMRYMGGVWGGAWVTSHICNLGNDRFDGAYLVQNFENLNPANTLWSKQYNLYAKIDSEVERYLNFEKWWTGFFQLTREEMEFIVNNLFVGNKLGTNQVTLSDGRLVSLKNIKAPIVVFCSGGDNITPPQQALNWILDVYSSDEEIIRDDQVIVYTLHKDIGHLGIFVSGQVAKKEHSAIVGTLEFIDRLPPGLYEMLIESSGEMAYDDPRVLTSYQVRFVERSLQDIQRLDDTREEELYFDTLAQVSDVTTQAYKSFVEPWVRPFVNERSAAALRAMNPARLQHVWLSDRNPALRPVRQLAEQVRANRQPAAANNPYLAIEREMAKGVETWFNAYRDMRDTALTIWFKAVYGPLGLGMFFPPDTDGRTVPVQSEAEQGFAALAERLRAGIAAGGFRAGVARLIVLLSRADHDVDPRTLLGVDDLPRRHAQFAGLEAPAVRALVKDQFLTIYLDRAQAVAALPQLLPGADERREALALASDVVLAGDKPNQAEKAVLDELAAVLGLSAESVLPGVNGNGEIRRLQAELEALRADNERLRNELAGAKMAQVGAPGNDAEQTATPA